MAYLELDGKLGKLMVASCTQRHRCPSEAKRGLRRAKGECTENWVALAD